MKSADAYRSTHLIGTWVARSISVFCEFCSRLFVVVGCFYHRFLSLHLHFFDLSAKIFDFLSKFCKNQVQVHISITQLVIRPIFCKPLQQCKCIKYTCSCSTSGLITGNWESVEGMTGYTVNWSEERMAKNYFVIEFIESVVANTITFPAYNTALLILLTYICYCLKGYSQI